MSEADKSAFSTVYREHYQALLWYIQRRNGGDLDHARDLVHDVWEIAWQRWHELPGGQQRPWLYGVAANLLANHHRRQQRADKAYLKAAENLVTQHTTVVGERLEWVDELDRVLHAMRQLKPQYQQALTVHAWEGLSGEALGKALGCSAAVASLRLFRARRRLQTVLRSQPATGAASDRSPVHAAHRPRTTGEPS